jgi:hypothetical protein
MVIDTSSLLKPITFKKKGNGAKPTITSKNKAFLKKIRLTPTIKNILLVVIFILIGGGIIAGLYFGLIRKKKCPNDCSGHGKCDRASGICSCNPGWTGDDCLQQVIKVCPNNCSGHGTCNPDGTCTCDKGWEGARDCSTPTKKECPKNRQTGKVCSGSGQGTCNTKTGICKCTGGYTGDDCSIPPGGCPQGQDVCQGTTGQFCCLSDKVCCGDSCCPKDQTCVTDTTGVKHCCAKGNVGPWCQAANNGKGACCKTQKQKCTPEGCCNKDDVCDDGHCCPGGCCEVGSPGGSKCCKYFGKTPGSMTCYNHKCQTLCGTGKHGQQVYCPSDYTCDKATIGGKTFDVCHMKGCEQGFSVAQNIPHNIDGINTCQNPSGEVLFCEDAKVSEKSGWTKKTVLNRLPNKPLCGKGDCFKALDIIGGVSEADFVESGDEATCTGYFYCQSPFLKKSCDPCPLPANQSGACCVKNGNLTGQICEDPNNVKCILGADGNNHCVNKDIDTSCPNGYTYYYTGFNGKSPGCYRDPPDWSKSGASEQGCAKNEIYASCNVDYPEDPDENEGPAGNNWYMCCNEHGHINDGYTTHGDGGLGECTVKWNPVPKNVYYCGKPNNSWSQGQWSECTNENGCAGHPGASIWFDANHDTCKNFAYCEAPSW